jgi:hypothetical protein
LYNLEYYQNLVDFWGLAWEMAEVQFLVVVARVVDRPHKPG